MLERFKVPKKDRVYVEEQKVRLVTEKVFVHLGLSQDAAKINADVLITNDLRGVESHGVSNGLRRYVGEYTNKELNPNPKFSILRESPTTLTIDADSALGTHVGPWAMQKAIDKAK